MILFKPNRSLIINMWINHNPVKRYNTDHLKIDTQWKTSYSYHCESDHLLVWIKIHIHSYATAV